MAAITCNIAKGRAVEFYHLIKNAILANAAFILIPVETSGLESDAVLLDKDTVTDFFSGTTNEQTTMGRKTVVAADLAAVPAPDDTLNKFVIALPTKVWTAPTGNAISKILVAFDYDTTTGTDATLVPVTVFDFVQTPAGVDITMTGGNFFEAT